MNPLLMDWEEFSKGSCQGNTEAETKFNIAVNVYWPIDLHWSHAFYIVEWYEHVSMKYAYDLFTIYLKKLDMKGKEWIKFIFISVS